MRVPGKGHGSLKMSLFRVPRAGLMGKNNQGSQAKDK